MATSAVSAEPSSDLGVAARMQRSLDRILRSSEQLQNAIDVDPDKRGGTPVLKGTRFKVSQFLAQLAHGDSIGDLEENLELDRDGMEFFLRSMSLVFDTSWKADSVIPRQ